MLPLERERLDEQAQLLANMSRLYRSQSNNENHCLRIYDLANNRIARPVMHLADPEPVLNANEW